ncbi:MAG: hypothetical protein ACI4TS_03810 [Bacteroidaceae bacterium]
MKQICFLIVAFATIFLSNSCTTPETTRFKTDYFGIDLNKKGYITGMWNTTLANSPNFSPTDKPSPLLSLYDEDTRRYYYPQQAVYNKRDKTLRLYYENNSVATLSIKEEKEYLRLQLQDLSPRNGIDDVQWGQYHTTITNLLGDVIGVARDTNQTTNYAIGALALNDNTIGGLSHYTSETGSGGYIIHSPDHEKYPLPIDLQEGQQFTMGGDGINDVAFYNRKAPYFRIIYGNAAGVDNSGRIDLRYHSRDRRSAKLIYSPEGVPEFANNEPNHLVRQAVEGVDYIGSAIALWGSPDSIALMKVIKNIVLKENLPYPTFCGKWVKDPSSFMPDLHTYGNCYDSIASYALQMGLRVIHAYDQPFLKANRANQGYIDGPDNEKKPFHFTTGNLSHAEYAQLLARDGLILGRTCITNSLAPYTQDCSPIPSDSLCIQHRRTLTNDISPTDTLICIDNPTYMNEIGCWEGHCSSLNVIKIGKELIHFLGVSDTPPYTLKKVTRGYWGTTPSAHTKGEHADKIQPTVAWGYDGLVPNLELQDEIARHYGDIISRSQLGMLDFDGQEFLFHTGFGTYGVKRFFRQLFNRVSDYNKPHLRFTGATLSEGSWHYQSVWNVGGGRNIYDVDTREWGSTTSQGKDLRDVTYANYFPSSFGVNFPITKNSTAQQYEHIEAIAVGHGATYMLNISQKDVEQCKDKYKIFQVIRTWEEARRANAFPSHVLKLLRNPAFDWHLEKDSSLNQWTLSQMSNGTTVKTFILKSRRD